MFCLPTSWIPWILLFFCMEIASGSTARRNKSILSGSPCRTPRSIVKGFVKCPLMRTCDLVFVFMDWTIWIRCFGNPSLDSVFWRKFWLTESNAFWKSSAIKKTSIFFLFACSYRSRARVAACFFPGRRIGLVKEGRRGQAWFSLLSILCRFWSLRLIR